MCPDQAKVGQGTLRYDTDTLTTAMWLAGSSIIKKNRLRFGKLEHMYEDENLEYTHNMQLADNAAEEAYERAIENGATEDEAYAASQAIFKKNT